MGVIGKLLAAVYSRGTFKGEPIAREQPCMVCHADRGILIARTAFWDLQESSLIRCPECGHIQLDPVLSEAVVETGCNAYFAFESMHETVKSDHRNRIRNYRRGILFASGLKRKGIHPRNILEFGPGSGYFSKGILHIFPAARVTVVDIVEEVLRFNRITHQFNGIPGTPGTISLKTDDRFDLIIARDILEHVADIRVMISDVASLLSPGGLFHFLTPNGLEDVWGHTVLWKLKQKPADLLINHISYFDGGGLKALLNEYHFEAVRYYTFQVKSFVKYGKGWRAKLKDASKPASYSNASAMIAQFRDLQEIKEKVDIPFTFPWYLTTKHSWITIFLCWYHHRVVYKFPPELNLGHEIFGLFRLDKPVSS